MTKQKDIKIEDVFTDDFLTDIVYLVTGRVLTFLVSFTIIGMILFNFIFSLSVGPSMCPSIPNNSIVIASKTKDVNIGDIIVFKSPDGDEFLTKRIVAKEGDTVQIGKDGLFVNGEFIKEDFSQGATFGLIFKFCDDYIVRKDKYYVLGDNREISMDSRDFGAIDKESIMGRVIFTFKLGEYINKWEHLPTKDK